MRLAYGSLITAHIIAAFALSFEGRSGAGLAQLAGAGAIYIIFLLERKFHS